MKDEEKRVCNGLRPKIRGKSYSSIADGDIKNDLKLLVEMDFIKKLEGHLRKEKTDSIKDDIFSRNLENIHTILIDTPDYNRKSTSSFASDLRELEKFWLSILRYGDEDEGQQVNLVMFFQKELWDLRPSFFCGKFNEKTLNPLTPKQLTEYYKTTLGDYYPFTEEALKELADLSRGIFRRFKKYVGLCVEQIGDLETSLEPSDVNAVIDLDVLVEDFEQELKNVFPRNRELRKKTVSIIRGLSVKPKQQKYISQTFFEAHPLECSRVLSALESWGYIERRFVNREKIVSLKET